MLCTGILVLTPGPTSLPQRIPVREGGRTTGLTPSLCNRHDSGPQVLIFCPLTVTAWGNPLETSDRSVGLSLSVIVPTFNERYLVEESLRRLRAAALPGIGALDILVVDDGSTDGTREILQSLLDREPGAFKLIVHARNQGKGAAVRTGIEAATGDLIAIHDADLEYDPNDLARLVQPFLEDGADVVYGSRFLPSRRRRVLYYRHTLGNSFLTFLSNWFTDLNLTDVETCYKMFRAELLRSIPIRSCDFGIELEITAKIAKRDFRVFEVPISYLGRTYREGKKVTWVDGIRALKTILQFWILDDLYRADTYGAQILVSLERAQRLNRWMADAIAPWVGRRVLEIGAGIGNISSWLIPRDRYVASDINEEYLHYLRNMALGKPYLRVEHVDVGVTADLQRLSETFDTVVCLNVLEHVTDPIHALRNIFDVLCPGGRVILYVPQHQGLYSSVDRVLGHRCRYDEPMLRRELAEAGFETEHVQQFNRLSMPGWWLTHRVLGRKTFSRVQIKIVDMLVPVLRVIDPWLPWSGLGLVAVARKPGVSSRTV